MWKIFSKTVSEKPEQADKIVLTSCNVDCGGRCVLRAHIKNGIVTRIETDQTGDDKYGQHQIRACLKGRSMRQRLYAPNRLKYPLKRVGKRGEGKFKRISWDEALDEITGRLNNSIENWGNESVFFTVGGGTLGSVMSNSAPPANLTRLMNCLGGYLGAYGTYSFGMMKAVLPYMFGNQWGDGNYITDIAHCKLAVFFCNNPGETRMSGGSLMHELLSAKQENNTRVIIIDPRYTDTSATVGDEWIPIRPGTDAALVAALAYVMITEDMVDQQFIEKFTVGYDEDTMPPGIPPHNSYKSYILGKGEDTTPKTPGWAAAITGIPAARIVQLAREIANAKPCYISQGWSLQRQANGEQNCRSICMLPVLTGNAGVRGGNIGIRESGFFFETPRFPEKENPVKETISCFTWTDAVEHGTDMTDLKDGVQGGERLKSSIKFIWAFASNLIVNQHSDINRTHEILLDETKCESIVVIDNFMTTSAKYADIVLPGTSNLEENEFSTSSYCSKMGYILFSRKAIEPMYERRNSYDIAAALAKRLGVEKEYTKGRTRDEWMEILYEDFKKRYPDLPDTLDEAYDMGVYRLVEANPDVPLGDFRSSPEEHPLDTQSGKIEIFSKQLWNLGKTWQLTEGDSIRGLPEYNPCWEGVSDPLRKEYPFQLITHHSKQRAHSTYGNVDWLKWVVPQQLWMNPIDAADRNISHGDKVKIFNKRGCTVCCVKVTPRIMPGVLTLPEGAWYDPDKNRVDQGGCPNVLTSQRPSPLAKGNPQHTNLVDVEKC